MGVLRCTAKYRKLVGLPNDLKDPQPVHSALGEWYGNPLNVGHDRYLHYMCEKARLSIVIPLKTRYTAEDRFTRTLYEFLPELGVAEKHAERELSTLNPLYFARAQNRSVLGSMNDQALAASYHLRREDLSLWDVMLMLSETPCTPLGGESPNIVAPRLITDFWQGPRLVN
jgi:hypothetical protein